MIDPKELRIGNYLVHEAVEEFFPIRVEAIQSDCINRKTVWDEDFPGTDFEDKIELKKIVGIPLTPKILENCGFIKTTDQHGYEHYKLSYRVKGGNTIVFYSMGMKDDPSRKAVTMTINALWASNTWETLHQLQNAYYSITGEELNVNL